MSALGADWARELDNLCFSPGSVAGIDVTISASGWSTQGGYELFVDDPTSAPELWDAVSDAGS